MRNEITKKNDSLKGWRKTYEKESNVSLWHKT